MCFRRWRGATRQTGDLARQAHDREIDTALAGERVVLDGLRRDLAQIKSDLAWRRLLDALARKYSPNQPRVIIDTTDLDEEGEAGGGDLEAFDNSDDAFIGVSDGDFGFDESFDASDDRPSSDSNSNNDRSPSGRRPTGITDTRVVSDADPEPVRPGEQYAQGRRVGGPRSDISAAQAARLSVAQGRANDAINRAREIDPTWNPRPSFESTIDGRINRYEAEAREAQQRIDQLSGIIGGGNSVGRSIANPQGRGLSAAEQRQLNEIMAETGCHRCGNIVPGTRSGNAIPDHQPPTALIFPGQSQRLFPHCATCSSAQGGFVSGILKRLR